MNCRVDDSVILNLPFFPGDHCVNLVEENCKALHDNLIPPFSPNQVTPGMKGALFSRIQESLKVSFVRLSEF